MRILGSGLVGIGILLAVTAQGQERVTPAPDQNALFHSSDPKLDANKQVVFHVEQDVLGCKHFDQADKYLTERYLQHNPNIPSGRASITKMLTMMCKPGAPSMTPKIVSVVAEGDYVIVANVQELSDSKNPGKTYTTTGFDMWRIKDGKADEHWDGATLGAMGGPPPGGAGGPPGGAPPAGAPR